MDRWYDLEAPRTDAASARKLCGWFIHEKFFALQVAGRDRFAGAYFNSDFTFKECVHYIEAQEILDLFLLVEDDYPSILGYARITGPDDLELVYAGNDEAQAKAAHDAVPAERARRLLAAQAKGSPGRSRNR